MDRRNFLAGAITGSAAYAASQPAGEMRVTSFVIVELMGHKKLCGRMSQGVAGLLQLDIPAEGGTITQMINPASVYRITICDETTVRKAAKMIDPLPSIELEVPMRQTFLGYRDDDEF